jgi:hypothetical protein
VTRPIQHPQNRDPRFEPPRQVHLHFHGVQAEDVAELVRRQQQDQGQP